MMMILAVIALTSHLLRNFVQPHLNKDSGCNTIVDYPYFEKKLSAFKKHIRDR